ncbi:MAG: hypothetical protein RRY10_02440, partial [Christensenellaceae bacterium]
IAFFIFSTFKSSHHFSPISLFFFILSALHQIHEAHSVILFPCRLLVYLFLSFKKHILPISHCLSSFSLHLWIFYPNICLRAFSSCALFVSFAHQNQHFYATKNPTAMQIVGF